MKIVLVAGARPNFMKIASIVDAIKAHNQSAIPLISHLLVHTGQHYDEQMSHAFFRDLALPRADVDLEVGSSSHARQTAEIMQSFEPVLLKARPDVVVVVGDVNSTIACSLVASKITYPLSTQTAQRPRPLMAHVEAGLRSFDRSMPEEINRILTDAISDFLFVSEECAEENLLKEGTPKEKIHFVGNTMVDTLLKHRNKAQESKILFRLGLKIDPDDNKVRSEIYHAPLAKRLDPGTSDYAVVTLHRPSNVDNQETFQEILESLLVVAKQIPILFPVHPRTMNRIKEFRFEKYFVFVTQHSKLEVRNPCINCLEPLGYLDFLCLMSNCKLVLTDSGGIQEEATVLGIPCITLRHNTERPVTITQGTNVLAGTAKEDIVRHAFSKLNQPARPRKPRFWDGHAGERIIKILAKQINDQR